MDREARLRWVTRAGVSKSIYFCLDEDHHKDPNLFVLYVFVCVLCKYPKALFKWQSSTKSGQSKRVYFCLDEDHHNDLNLFILYVLSMFFANIQKSSKWVPQNQVWASAPVCRTEILYMQVLSKVTITIMMTMTLMMTMTMMLTLTMTKTMTLMMTMTMMLTYDDDYIDTDTKVSGKVRQV